MNPPLSRVSLPKAAMPARVGLEIDLLGGQAAVGFDEEAARHWLCALVPEVGAALARLPAAVDRRRDVDSFAVRFVDDVGMMELNSRYRHKKTTTDVLSFPGEVTAEGHHLGDVAISLPQAQRQCLEAGTGLSTELQRLLLHGVLHCFGLDHETDGGEMERLEQTLRERWIRDRAWSLPETAAT